MLSQMFWINYRSFTSVVLCTQTLHQQWLHTRECYKIHRSATTMVISLSLRFVDQIGTSVRFWPKKVKCWNFEGDCEQNGSTGKVVTWRVLIYSWNMTFSYKMQKFVYESSWSSLTHEKNNIYFVFIIISKDETCRSCAPWIEISSASINFWKGELGMPEFDSISINYQQLKSSLIYVVVLLSVFLSLTDYKCTLL